MSLRRKLTISFGTLAFMALLIVGATLWSNNRYEAADEELRRHYNRSLLVQRVRASTFRATEELSDAVFQREPDFRTDFDQRIDPARRDLELWSGLADFEEEQQEVDGVSEAFEVVVARSERVFDAVDAGRLAEARRLYEGRIDNLELDRFEALTDKAVAADRGRRDEVRATVTDTRRTGQLILLIAAFGTVSLVLLSAGFLASDLLRPIGRLREGLERIAGGDRSVHLDEGRADELGQVQRAFDAMVEALGQREAVIAASASADADAGADDGLASQPSRLALHRLVARLRTRVATLDEHPEGREAVVAELDNLVRAVGRMTDLGFPLDLDLARVEVGPLLHEVADRHRDEIVRRGVRLEVAPAPELGAVLADRLKLREVLSELVDNALAALPERGGSLGLRALTGDDGTRALIDVADGGGGEGAPSPVDALYAGGEDDEGHLPVGLPSSRAIIEAHGGRLIIDSRPEGGTLVRIELALAD